MLRRAQGYAPVSGVSGIQPPEAVHHAILPLCPPSLQQSAKAALTHSHRPGGLTNRNLIPHTSGGEKSDRQVLAGLISSET